jgi:hypothetical protein
MHAPQHGVEADGLRTGGSLHYDAAVFGNGSPAPKTGPARPLDYATRWSAWSWPSQLDIWFQLVKIWVTTLSSALSDGAK